jgi:hypothetical protein
LRRRGRGGGGVLFCWRVWCVNSLVEVKKESPPPPPLRPLMGLLTGRLFVTRREVWLAWRRRLASAFRCVSFFVFFSVASSVFSNRADAPCACMAP